MAERRGSVMQGRRKSVVHDPIEMEAASRKSVRVAEDPAAAKGRRGSVKDGRRKSVAGGRRKSVAAGAAGSRRKSVVTATTPKELGEQGLASSSGGRVGDVMWARMPPKHPEVYEKVTVTEAIAGTKVKVSLPDGTGEEYAISDLLPCNQESDLNDVCAMTYLSEAAVLDCVKVRYLRKKIYTWTARILIAMNPFERLAIYDDDVKLQYSKLDPRSAPPHIFAIGEHAYRSVARKGKFKNQAIIVSGESGSGKTVGNKLLMDYFAYRSGNASASQTTDLIAKV